MTRRHRVFFIVAAVLMLLLIPAGLTSGSVSLGLRQIIDAFGAEGTLEHFIVVETRLPAILTAALAGAGLSLAGLLMQTCFDNPLAGPSIMGISSGASLGVALVMLAGVGFAGVWGTMAVIAGALLGAAVILAILLLFSGTVRSSEVLLIVGVLIGYLVSSIISLLNFFAPDHAVHGFVVWGMGNFSSVTLAQMPIFGGLCLALCLASAFYVKSLNALLFGADYARTLGVSVNAARSAMLAIAGGLTAVITAWCGPIAFLGLAMPHIARMLLRTSNHRLLLPGVFLVGAIAGMLCQILSVLPSPWYAGILPVNAITPIVGVPVILYVLINRRKLLYFN